jgi:hypothetical protein
MGNRRTHSTLRGLPLAFRSGLLVTFDVEYDFALYISLDIPTFQSQGADETDQMSLSSIERPIVYIGRARKVLRLLIESAFTLNSRSSIDQSTERLGILISEARLLRAPSTS